MLPGNKREKLICTYSYVIRCCMLFIFVLSVRGIINTFIFQQKSIGTVHVNLRQRDTVFPRVTYNLYGSALCPPTPPNLEGPIHVNTSQTTYDDIEKRYPWVRPGGKYNPLDCIARHKVAIIIPFRNRELHLKILLNNIHHFLRKQQLDYGIYVIHQEEGSKFNRAMLINIGFVETTKIDNYTCFVFHDVDLLPEDDRNIYGCYGTPRHLAAAIDKFHHRLPYENYFGGVIAMSRTEFEKINGCSNQYFGWGAEDDDMYNRIVKSQMTVVRYPMHIARYKMIKHGKDYGNGVNEQRIQLLENGSKTIDIDGLNSLKYTLTKIETKKLYTRISVQIIEKEVKKGYLEDRILPWLPKT